MHKKPLIIIFVFAAMVLMAAVESNTAVKNFEWLKGSWIMKKKNSSAIMENWQQLNDSTMAGESVNFSVTGSSSVSENMQITFRNNRYNFVSIVNGQNNNEPVSFSITSYTDTGFTAENPAHDFPKRIVYQLINKDSIHAFIDGGQLMPDKKINFYYSRYKN
jgi:Domain of unknown function (DUF6265)